MGAPPDIIENLGSGVNKRIRGELEKELKAAGRSAAEAKREVEVLARLSSTIAQITGQDAGELARNTVRFKKAQAATGGARLNQAAMYRAKSETVEDFIVEANATDPTGNRPFFHFDNKFGNTLIELGADQVRHITGGHPDFTDWARIPEVIERGKTVSAGPNRVTGTESFIYTLEDNGSTLVVVTAPNIGGGKRRKSARTIVLTAFRDTTAAVNHWVENNKAASSPRAEALQLNPRSNEANPTGPQSGNSNIARLDAVVKASEEEADLKAVAPEEFERVSHARAKALEEAEKLITEARVKERVNALRQWRREGQYEADNDPRWILVDDIVRRGGQYLIDSGYDDAAIAELKAVHDRLVSENGTLEFDVLADEKGYSV